MRTHIGWPKYAVGLTTVLVTLSLGMSIAMADPAPAPVASKPATEATKATNAALLKTLPFNDKADFEDATRGLIARPEQLTIRDAAGKVVWDMESYKKYISLDQAAPDEINPSLYRIAQLNMQYGLFKVTDRIYQVRGFDLSNITFVQGDKGWIVFDPLVTKETAKAAFDLVTEKLGKRPVDAVIYSHSHVDHFGGARAAYGLEQPGFADLLALLRTGKIYVKISGAYRASKLALDYADAAPLARALIDANADRIVWGTDWPHPDSVTPPGRNVTDTTPLLQIDDGRLLNQLPVWAPDAAIRRKILVDNPARLYGF